MPAAHAGAAELILNGGFESQPDVIQSPDPITAWTAAENGILGAVVINTGTNSPVSGRETVGARTGTHYALLDLASPSQLALSQTFNIGASPLSAATLSFQWFANYYGPETGFINDAADGLDFENFPVLTLRVDILNAGASAFSTAPDNLLYSQFLQTTLSEGPNGYLGFSQSIGALDNFLVGRDYTLRIAAAANTQQLLIGIDDVSLSVTPVPEPQSTALLLAGLTTLAAVARRRRA